MLAHWTSFKKPTSIIMKTALTFLMINCHLRMPKTSLNSKKTKLLRLSYFWPKPRLLDDRICTTPYLELVTGNCDAYFGENKKVTANFSKLYIIVNAVSSRRDTEDSLFNPLAIILYFYEDEHIDYWLSCITHRTCFPFYWVSDFLSQTKNQFV